MSSNQASVLILEGDARSPAATSILQRDDQRPPQLASSIDMCRRATTHDEMVVWAAVDTSACCGNLRCSCERKVSSTRRREELRAATHLPVHDALVRLADLLGEERRAAEEQLRPREGDQLSPARRERARA